MKGSNLNAKLIEAAYRELKADKTLKIRRYRDADEVGFLINEKIAVWTWEDNDRINYSRVYLDSDRMVNGVHAMLSEGFKPNSKTTVNTVTKRAYSFIDKIGNTY